MKKMLILGLALTTGYMQSMVPAVPVGDYSENRIGTVVGGSEVPAVRAVPSATPYRVGTVVGGDMRPAVRALPQRLYILYGVKPEKVHAVQESIFNLISSYESQRLTPQQRAAMRDLLVEEIFGRF